MTEQNSDRIITPMPRSLVERIDDFRFANRMASRADAIRTLIEKGLEAAAQAGNDDK
jgi:metal-responsive CopG/Arc/MetJ family transcriptional regulator